MYQKERIDNIVKLLEKDKYLTVKYIAGKIGYSNATINRDLNILEKKKIIKRTYGGVEIIKRDLPPLPFRYEYAKNAKKKIAKKACEFIKDGERVFIDGTTTTEYMGEYLTEKKDITVITPNIELALNLSKYGMEVIVLGGKLIEGPMVQSSITVENARKFMADKFFFSTRGVSSDGKIMQHSDNSCDLYFAMKENSKKIYYLVDKKKLDLECNFKLFDIEEIDTVISDFEFSESLKKSCKKTKFIKVGE